MNESRVRLAELTQALKGKEELAKQQVFVAVLDSDCPSNRDLQILTCIPFYNLKYCVPISL